MIDSLDKLHGDTFNVAYHIGEDLCVGGNILVSAKVKARLIGEKNFENCEFKLFENEEDGDYV